MGLGVQVKVGEPAVAGSLAVFPLFSADEEGPPYLCGPDAFSAEVVSIQETDADGEVESLLVTNHSELPLLLLEGETFLGLKQNRTLNVSVLCPAGSELVAPVSCVEAGRWGAASPAARSARHAPTRVRAVMTASLVDDPRRGRRDSDQHEVWEAVDVYARAALHAGRRPWSRAPGKRTGRPRDRFGVRGIGGPPGGLRVVRLDAHG